MRVHVRVWDVWRCEVCDMVRCVRCVKYVRVWIYKVCEQEDK